MNTFWVRKYSYELDTSSRIFNLTYDLVQTPDKGLILVGETNDETGPVVQYGWLLKVDEYGCLIPGCQYTNTTNPDKPAEWDLLLYPNPASDYLTFLIKTSHVRSNDFSYKILNSEGKILKSDKNINAEINYFINLRDFSSGNYFQSFHKNILLGTKLFTVLKNK